MAATAVSLGQVIGADNQAAPRSLRTGRCGFERVTRESLIVMFAPPRVRIGDLLETSWPFSWQAACHDPEAALRGGERPWADPER